MEASLCADVGVVELGPGVGVFGVVALVGGVKSNGMQVKVLLRRSWLPYKNKSVWAREQFVGPTQHGKGFRPKVTLLVYLVNLFITRPNLAI